MLLRAGCLALLLTLVPGLGRAAPVTVWLLPNYGGSGYNLVVGAEPGVSIVGINFVIAGFDDVTLNPAGAANISFLDSAFLRGVFGDDRDAVVINAPAGAALGLDPVPLATFTGSFTGFCPPWNPPCPETPYEFHDHPDYFGGTVLSTTGEWLEYDLYLYDTRHVTDPPYPAPEPATTLLAALSLFGVVASRSLRRA